MGKFQAISVSELRTKRLLKPEDQQKFNELKGYVESLSKRQAGIYECDPGENPGKMRSLLRKVAEATATPLRIQLEGSRVVFIPREKVKGSRPRRRGREKSQG